jgi:pyrroline-5-carboxylate reductase
MSFVSHNGQATAVNIDNVIRLYSLCGEVMEVQESQVEAGMMMASCGIAYVMRMVRAMTEGGVEMGFYPAQAQKIAIQTMQGAVTLLNESGLHPEVAIDKVTTPGGVTIKGLNELDRAGFNAAVVRCLKAGMK